MRRKILVVEDNLDLVELLRKLLETLGYEVCVATKGTEAVQMAAAEDPDLILLDIMLPEINGFEVAAQVRRHPRIRSIPIVAMTANFDFRMKVRSIAAGCDAFLTKPFTDKQLTHAIGKLLRSGREESPTA